MLASGDASRTGDTGGVGSLTFSFSFLLFYSGLITSSEVWEACWVATGVKTYWTYLFGF